MPQIGLYGLFNNEEYRLKGVLDKKGILRSQNIIDQIVQAKMNHYVFKDWPFPHQTPQELLYYLWFYGKVIYLNIPGIGLQFFPFSSDKPFLTKGNVHLANITIKENFNKRVLTKAFISDAIKKGFPFIFINTLQKAPFLQQEQLFEDLRAVYNSNSSNRSNKNKSHIVFVPPGAKYAKAIHQHITNPDASPFFYIERNPKDSNNDLKQSDFGQMTTNTNDLYNSYAQEAKDIIQELKIYNGLPTNISFNKGSAQETDSQTQSQRIETAFTLKDEWDQLYRDFKRLRANTGKTVEVFLNDDINTYIQQALAERIDENKENADENKENADEIKENADEIKENADENKENADEGGIIERIKNLLKITPKPPKPKKIFDAPTKEEEK